jgi:hypothetical protein
LARPGSCWRPRARGRVGGGVFGKGRYKMGLKKWWSKESGVKVFLQIIAMFAALYIVFNYLTNIQLIWAAIAILVILTSLDSSKMDRRIQNIASKLDIVDEALEDKLGFDKVDLSVYHGLGLIRPKDIECDTIETKNITTDEIHIADCFKIIRKGDRPYILIYDDDEYYGTAIGINELRELLKLLIKKELNLDDINEQKFILRTIKEKEELIEKWNKMKTDDDYKDDDDMLNGIDKDIQKFKNEIDELNKWSEKISENDY